MMELQAEWTKTPQGPVELQLLPLLRLCLPLLLLLLLLLPEVCGYSTVRRTPDRSSPPLREPPGL